MQRTLRTLRRLSVTTLIAGLSLGVAQASFLLEIDTDGLDDGALTFNPNFSFGGDTTTASQSNPSTAFGLSGGDSIFGGNGLNQPDTYVYTYTPSVDADNLSLPAGTDLGGGLLASGLAGGAPGVYAVYATWPISSNVSGGDTLFSAATAGDAFATTFDQNGAGAGTGHQWYKMGEITWSSGTITMTQQPTGGNTFVSMRAAAVLFEAIPEPSTLALLGLGLLAAAGSRSRR